MNELIKKLNKTKHDGYIIPDIVFEILDDYQTSQHEKRKEWLKQYDRQEGDVMVDAEGEEYIFLDERGNKKYLVSEIQSKIIS